MPIRIPNPDLQTEFAASLLRLREVCLLPALRRVAGAVDVVELDQELARLAPRAGLAKLASVGLRGETAFCTPLILRTQPALLGYYRLLLGFSQKAFFTRETGLGRFKALEDGRLPDSLSKHLEELCQAMNDAAGHLVGGLAKTMTTAGSFADLTLLTLGAQLRGGANVRKGVLGIERVFVTIQTIVGHAAQNSTPSMITLINSAGRRVQIEFSADPDIIIREALSKRTGDWRNVIAIEIKAGTDFSNIHNRIGEAEKSHQKAKRAGYTECWTIVNVDPFDAETARKESPSTNRFYRLSQIESRAGTEYEDFRDRILALTGVAAGGKERRKRSVTK